MKHALVVGGTGMLSNTSLWLVSKGYHVSVIGRAPNKMESLISKSIDKSLVTPLLVDYSDEVSLKEKLKKTIEQDGPIQLVVAWVHSYAESAVEIVAREVSNRNDKTWKLFHVLGSSRNLIEVKEKVRLPDNTQYHQVQLGAVIKNGHSRWLTNEEISQGVIDAIENGKSINIIGEIPRYPS